MGKQSIVLTCRLENVTNLRLPGDEDWYFILQCGQCGEKTDNEIYFNPVEVLEIEVIHLPFFLLSTLFVIYLNSVLNFCRDRKVVPITLQSANSAKGKAQSPS